MNFSILNRILLDRAGQQLTGIQKRNRHTLSDALFGKSREQHPETSGVCSFGVSLLSLTMTEEDCRAFQANVEKAPAPSQSVRIYHYLLHIRNIRYINAKQHLGLSSSAKARSVKPRGLKHIRRIHNVFPISGSGT